MEKQRLDLAEEKKRKERKASVRTMTVEVIQRQNCPVQICSVSMGKIL